MRFTASDKDGAINHVQEGGIACGKRLLEPIASLELHIQVRRVGIVVAHRPSAIVNCDLVGIIQQGRLVAFGPKDEIFKDQAATRQSPDTVPPRKRQLRSVKSDAAA